MPYGKICDELLFKEIKFVCNMLGYGKNKNAHNLLIETCLMETWLGDYEDKDVLNNTDNEGVGIMQFDSVGFFDVYEYGKRKEVIKTKIYNCLGINFENLYNISYLRYDTLISFLFARIKYMKIENEIPENIEVRSEYYKYWYNSVLGDAEPKEYVKRAIEFYKKFGGIDKFDEYFFNLKA